MKKITVVITLFLLTLSTVLAAKTDPVRDLYTLRDMQIKYIKMLESCNTLDDLKAGKNSLISFQVKMKKLRLHAYRGILNRSIASQKAFVKKDMEIQQSFSSYKERQLGAEQKLADIPDSLELRKEIMEEFNKKAQSILMEIDILGEQIYRNVNGN